MRHPVISLTVLSALALSSPGLTQFASLSATVTQVSLLEQPAGLQLAIASDQPISLSSPSSSRGQWSVMLQNARLRADLSPFWQSQSRGVTVALRQTGTNQIQVTVRAEGRAPAVTIRRDAERLLSLDITAGDPRLSTSGPEITNQNRAVAPPVGDLAIATLAVPRGVSLKLTRPGLIRYLSLSSVPLAEILPLLARLGNFNLIFDDSSEGLQGTDGSSLQGAPAGTGRSRRKQLSLHLENISVEEAATSIIQAADLLVSRRGRVWIVARELGAASVDTITRTVRLNQASADDAARFLNLQGAAVSTVTNPTQFVAGTGGFTGATGTSNNQNTALNSSPVIVQQSGPVVSTLQPPSLPGVYYPLRNLIATADTRLNQITLVGPSQSVQLALKLLEQLDLRKRQVTLNVKVIDLNLNQVANLAAKGSGFSFKVGDTFITNTNGAMGLNSGPVVGPGVVGINLLNNTAAGGANNFIANTGLPVQYPGQFIASLQAEIINGNAKILTDPNLTIQEGEESNVRLVQSVVRQVQQSVTQVNGAGAQTATNVAFADVGLTLAVKVDRIDDNGFITVQVNPTIVTPLPPEFIPGVTGFVTNLQTRQVSSGRVRLRDGESLILSGIIQDSEREAVTKWPILGDIPIIGSLFRGSSTTRERREVIVVLTPNLLSDATGLNPRTPTGPELSMPPLPR